MALPNFGTEFGAMVERALPCFMPNFDLAWNLAPRGLAPKWSHPFCEPNFGQRIGKAILGRGNSWPL